MGAPFRVRSRFERGRGDYDGPWTELIAPIRPCRVAPARPSLAGRSAQHALPEGSAWALVLALLLHGEGRLRGGHCQAPKKQRATPFGVALSFLRPLAVTYSCMA